ncbi:MAG TPA: rhomboid family intramembrane serine protease [Clostridia bacterium]|nr:rhomboid family intramembrane serine protease [Clostridia bacterium]
MIPLKDDAPRLTTPYMTYFLLAANIIVFLFEVILQGSGQRALERFIFQFGVVPVRIPIALLNGGYVPQDLVHQLGTRFVPPVEAVLPVFTSMFLHGSWLHLIANMWALWIFGDNVEDHLGHFLYLVMYLASGIAAALLHTAFNLGSLVPSVGASGAIAGVMGAYFLLYPSARVLTLLPFFFVFFVWLPAWIVLGYWFVVQFLSGAATAIVATQSTRAGGGIAFWAHVGGFVAGALLVKLFPARPRRYRYYGL